MIKKVHICVILISLCIIVGGVLIYDIHTSAPPYVPANNISHGFSFDCANIEWDDDLNELTFTQKFYTPQHKDFENIGILINFYNGNKHIGYQYIHIDKSINGSFDVNFTVTVSEHPTKWTSEVVKSKEI